MKKTEKITLEDTKGYFNQIAGDWGSHYSETGLMRDRIKRFIGAIEKFANPRTKILDFGCGSGELTRAISEKGWKIKGCDFSEEMLNRAKDIVGEDDVDWHLLTEQRDLELPFEDSSFDVIIASSVFEYMHKPKVYLHEFHRVLSNNGRILISVPDMRHSLRIKEQSLRRNSIIKVLRRIWNWSIHGKDTDYLKYSITRYPPEDWLDLLRECSFNPLPISGPGDPLLLLQAEKDCDD